MIYLVVVMAWVLVFACGYVVGTQRMIWKYERWITEIEKSVEELGI